jgi:exosortase E/protease (VPEID-CTERM system)
MWLVYQLIRPFVAEPRYVPDYAVIGTQTFQIMIAPKCSGYQGIGLVSVFLGVYLFAFRRTLRFPHALLLLPIGAVVMWIVNGVRIAALIAVGTLISEEVAVGGFHANSGSLLLCVVALGLGWLGHVHPFFSRAPARPTTRFADGPAASHLAPLVVIAATAMLTGAASSGGFDLLYGLRVVAAGLTLWSFRHAYRDWRVEWSWPAIAIGVVVLVLWLALEPKPADGAGSALATGLAALSPGGRVSWLALRVAGAVVTVPIVEELAFRGYLAPRLTLPGTATEPGRLSWVGIVASSLLFGAMHDRVLAGTIAGVLYALVFARRGALGDAILAHATTNALLAAYVLATGSWFLW